MRGKYRRDLARSFFGFIGLMLIWALLIYWQGTISLNGLGENLVRAFRFEFAEIEPAYKSLIWGMTLLTSAVSFSTLFFVSFSVPLTSRTQIPQILGIFSDLLLGRQSAATILRNGESNKLDNGMARITKQSILQLDASSAVLLRRGSVLTRALGPGFHISKRREIFAGALDLRIQRRISGPLENEDPFAPKQKDEGQAAFLARKGRQEESTALSKDGVEIVPRIELQFQIAGRHGSTRDPFPFQAEFAWRALAHEGVSAGKPSDLRDRQVNWDWIPSQLAIDLWRIFLRKYTVSDLFEELPMQSANNGSSNAQTGLEEIEKRINERLKNALVAGSQGKQSSPEYQFLRNRGIRVIGAYIRELHLDPRKEEARLVNEWSQDWEFKAIQKTLRESESTDNGKRDGLEKAARDFVRLVSEDLVERLSITDGEIIPPPEEEESLRLVLSSISRNLDGEPELESQVAKRVNRFRELFAEEDNGN